MGTKSTSVLSYPGQYIRRQQIANRLNILHFRGEPLLVVVRHRIYDYSLVLKAVPQICHGKKLQATWTETDFLPRNLHQYDLDKIIIPGIATSLEFKSDNVLFEADQIHAEIPEQLQATSGRQICRHKVTGEVDALITQHGISFKSTLLDFSPLGLRLKITISDLQSFYWLNTKQVATLTLSKEGETFFSGIVRVLRDEGDQGNRIIVVAPTSENSPRYRPKIKRTKRFVIHPCPDLSFIHPITGDNITLPVRDISTLGFSIRENPEKSLLMTGMILKDVSINLFGREFLNLSAQVVYRKFFEDTIICGVAILDISIDDHLQLIGLVHKAEDENSFVSINQEPEKFFEFLFDTGFLYPSKYEEVYSNKDAFVDAYRKLYLSPSQIARCFVYLEKNQIYGHVSALKIYRHSWLNHHHAAFPNKRSGLRVLRQISDFHNDSYVLNPLQMRYVIGIWRPNNNFPAKFFGSFAAETKNLNACSTDTFSYLRMPLGNGGWDNLSGPWEVVRANRQDVCEFEGYYQNVSGGLLAKAFDLTVDSFEDQSVALEYEKNGLKRERHLFAVRYGLDLIALVDIQDSDTGLNLSDLTNSAYIYILDTKLFTPKVLENVKHLIAAKKKCTVSSIMIFPSTYVDQYQISQDKEYTVWILNTEFSDAYMQHLSRWCR